MSILRLEHIEKEYGKGEAKLIALKNINMTVEKGEMVAITGPSGSGKSTLLNILGCIDNITKGKYFVNGTDVSNYNNRKFASLRNRTFGFVVQHFALLEDYSIFDNIGLPLEYAGVIKKRRKEIIYKLAEELGIVQKLNRRPGELSGGQNQRVAIARALSNNPEIILADEPTGALDKKTGNEVLDIFRNLNRQGKTIIIVTHDEKVSNICQRTIRIEDGCIA